MTVNIELRADRELLNPDFEKYQFYSEDTPIKYEKQLETGKYNLNNYLNI